MSAGASPMPSVWISTVGGANSGKTSTGIFLTWPTPTNIRAPARATMRNRNLRLAATMARIMVLVRPF